MKQKKEQKKLMEDLIHLFIHIDEKIKFLHKDSSEVFLQLNTFLKDYYKKYGIITKNASQIFDTTKGGLDNNLSVEFDQIYKELKVYKQGTENENTSNQNLLNQLKGKANYISVIVRNFKQELTTFIFLITNYKLISNNENYNKSANETIKKWEKLVLNSQEKLRHLSKEIDNLIVNINSLSQNSQSFYNDSINKVFNFFEELKTSNVLISEKEKESNILLALLNEKMQSSKECIGNIITHLQYHDIIRQKIEHIQTSHKSIIESLDQENTSADEDSDQDDEKRKLSLISNISGLQAAQLILISKEYQKALEVITKNFEKITTDLTSVSNKSNEFSFETENSDTTIIKSVKDKLDDSILILDSFNLTTYNIELSELLNQFEEVYSLSCETVFDPLSQFEKLTLHIGDTNNFSDKKDDSPPNILIQLASLSKDIVEKRDALKFEFEESIGFSKEIFEKRNQDEFGSIQEKEQIRLMVKISKMLEKLDNENKVLDNLLVQNSTLSNDIINKLKETINYSEYYELFENILNEIIESLNSINNRLVEEDISLEDFDQINDLKEIEALYTVASERIIHNRVVEGNNDLVIPENENEQEDDLELF